MKFSLSPKLLPWVPLGTGAAGLGLRIWLFCLTDSKGLLPAGHIANTLSFLLTALTLALIFLCTGPLSRISNYKQLFPAGIRRAVGCALGAAAFVYAGIRGIDLTNLLGILTPVLALLAAGAMGYLTYCRLKDIHPSCLFHAVPTVYLMLHAVVQVRSWNSESQLSVYFFPLLACLLLMVTAYQHCLLDAQKGSRRSFVLFNQAALFCCLLSINDKNGLFYLGMAGWLACDLCSLQLRRPRRVVSQEES